jgi:2-oxoglutarate dehydrogenase E2 component (dihydrolipoamide succinyltransferase)
MPTPIVMPQMGESIAEGTVVRWIKKVGDPVERDEPLFEITTDKVDAEIPAPAAGVLAEIAVHEGETVPVNSVVGTIVQPGEVLSPKNDGPPAAAPPQVGAKAAAPDGSEPEPGEGEDRDANDLRRSKSSPVVRRIERKQ